MSVLGSLFGGRRRRPRGRHAQSGTLPAQTILPGFAAPHEPVAGVQAAPEPAAEYPPETEEGRISDRPEAGPRVGLFFGDGSHVVMEADDPRAGAFAAIADELNH